MSTNKMTALGAAFLFALSGSAFANDLGVLSPETVGSTLYGSTDMVVHVPVPGESRAQTVAPVDVTNVPQAATPTEGQFVDMSGRDGTLRACYAAGGIAKQGQDLAYRCTFVQDAAPATQSAYIAPSGTDTGYDGSTDVEDPALLDCMSRGGSLIQLAGNGQYACAM